MSLVFVEPVSAKNWAFTTLIAAPTSRSSVRRRVPANVDADW